MPAFPSLSTVSRCAASAWLRRLLLGLSALGVLWGLPSAPLAQARAPRGSAVTARPGPRDAASPPAGGAASGGPTTREYIDTPPFDEGQARPYDFEASGADGGFGAGPYVDGPYPDGPYGDGYADDGYFGAGPCCGSSCCGLWNQCSLHNFYVRADYLLWWGKGFYAPPLVTTSDAGTSQANAGVLGLSTTSVLFPTGNLATAAMSGGQIRLGYWFDPCDTSALEGTYFGFGNVTTNYSASSINDPILARPFVNVEEGSVGNDAQLIAYPGLYTGSISVNGSSQLAAPRSSTGTSSAALATGGSTGWPAGATTN